MPHRTLAFATTAAVILTAVPAAAQDPYTRPDDSWISISGTVVSPTADSFMLDYGDGLVTVEQVKDALRAEKVLIR